jgi:protein N-terminal methyltransferase
MADIDAVGVAPDAQIDHSAAIEYWAGISADVDGMLGGFPHVSRVDLQGSRALMAKLGVLAPKEEGGAKPLRRVVDCGAG